MTCSENHDAFERRVAEDMERLAKGKGRKLCGYDGCKKQSYYGFTRGKPLTCVDHVYDHPQTKVPMICVKNLCTFTDDRNFICTSTAIYGTKGKGGKRISCREHKEDMARNHGVDGFCLKTCKECRTDECYGVGLYYLKSDINDPNKSYVCCMCVTRQWEVIDPLYECTGPTHKCKVTEGCGGRATYCLRTDRTEKRVACNVCAKNEEDIYKNVLAPVNTCITCLDLFKVDPTHEKKQRCYGFADQEINETLAGDALYCDQCRPPGTVNLIHPLCVTPYCLEGVRKRGDMCAMHRTKNSGIRKKERAVGKVLDSVPGAWINNRAMDDTACGKYRPDFRLDMEDRVVIVECNEHAHTGGYYSASCENKRTLDIHGAANGKPVIIIAFNPDKKTADNVPIGSSYPGTLARHQKLLEIVRQALEFPVTLGMLHVWYTYHGDHIPFTDAHRPVEANVDFLTHDTESTVLRQFTVSIDHGLVDEHDFFHPFVRELPVA